MNKITVIIENGKINLDFEGFVGNVCEHEENATRLILGKMGVKTDVKKSERTEESQRNHITEQEKC